MSQDPRQAAKAKYEKLFQNRRASNPAAFTLPYWEKHFVTTALSGLPGLRGKALDIGCGTGEVDVWLARRHPELELEGVDISQIAIEVARQHAQAEAGPIQARLHFQEMDFESLAFGDGVFDWVFLSHVLEHIPDPAPLFREIARVLKPAGKLAMVVPRGHCHDDPDHCWHFEPEAWQSFADLYGRVENMWVSPDSQQVAMVLAPRRQCQLAAMLRVRNVEDYLGRALQSLEGLADAIVILDDGSTDRTLEIARSHWLVKKIVHQEHGPVDEVRDKNLLLKAALELDPDWILALDGDEEIEAGGQEFIRRAMDHCQPQTGSFSFDFPYFWNDEDHVRFDGLYAEVTRHPRLFRVRGNLAPNLAFAYTAHGAGLHCGSLPNGLRGETRFLPVKIKHYGYLHPSQRQEKYQFYQMQDPAGFKLGYYEHLVREEGMILIPWRDRSEALRRSEGKLDDYYTHDRPEVLAGVPPKARRILELGCASGRLGRSLKNRQICYLVGIELSPNAAGEALKYFDEVMVADIETAELPFPEGFFDCLICADVLEHLRDPWTTLQRLAKWLRPQGTLVCSIPNIRNLGVLGQLAQGAWNYVAEGILDKTHLRFFTRQTFEALLRASGFSVTQVRAIKDTAFNHLDYNDPGQKATLAWGRVSIRDVSAEEFAEFTALQFLFVGCRQSVAVSPVVASIPVSVVIPVFNQVAHTQACLEALANNTPGPLFELIMVDNASTDATPELLKCLEGDVKVITNSENQGFVRACNQGAAVAQGQYLLFLNNDTLPAPGWLEALLQLIKRDPTIGAVGAKLVYPDGRLQEAGGMIFSDGSGWNFGRGDDPNQDAYNQVSEVDYCSGACLLVRKDLFERLSGFDARYAPAYYEDADLCFGIRSLGCRVMYCPTSRVVHCEGATAGTDLNSGFKQFQARNREKFREKWGTELKRQDQNPAQTRKVPTTASRARLSVAGETPGTNQPPAGAERWVLVMDPLLPWHDRAAGSLRLFHILKIILSLGWKITYIARYGLGQEAYQRELEAMGIQVFATDPEMLAKHGRPVKAAALDLKKILREKYYALAWLSFFDIAEDYLAAIRELSPETKIVIDTVDVHFLREQRQAELYHDAPLMEKAANTKQRELAIYAQSDALITVTPADQDILRPYLPEKEIRIVPLIHPVQTGGPAFAGRHGVLFVGNFNHLPNQDAMKYFCTEILPIVHRTLPELQLTIVGGNPPEVIKSLAGPSIIVTGGVPETAPYIHQSRISIAPLRYGAGMKGKVGEALSLGLPVVTTRIGAEGMGLTPDEEILIGDDPQAFAQAVIRLYQDEALWNQLSRKGQAFMATHYSVEVITGQVLAVLDSASRSAAQGIESQGAPVSAEGPPAPLTSIVILTHNQCDYTRQCVESVFRQTRVPYELILVDNASSDQTRDYLRKLPAQKPAACREIRLIENPSNLGFARGNNQGLAAAAGDFILLLNNDVVVTAGWLERLLACAQQNPNIGIVGPMSNCVSGPQQIQTPGYDQQTLRGLEEFARAWSQTRRGRSTSFWRVVGFCMLIKRTVVEKIGGLDSRYGLGNFEDDDFSLRATVAGFTSRIAEDCFVHHFGSRTFRGEKIDYGQSLRTNWEIFKRKWKLPLESAYGTPVDLSATLRGPFSAEHYCALT